MTAQKNQTSYQSVQKRQKLSFFQQFDDSIVQMKKEKEKAQKNKIVAGAIPAAKKEEAKDSSHNVVQQEVKSPVAEVRSPESQKGQLINEESHESSLNQEKKGPRKFNKPKAIKGKNGLVDVEEMQNQANLAKAPMREASEKQVQRNESQAQSSPNEGDKSVKNKSGNE